MTELGLQIIGILAPGFLLAMVGLTWFHRGPEFPVPFVTSLVINVCMPALLFHTLASTSVDLSAMGSMAVAALATQCIFMAAAFTLLKVSNRNWRHGVSHVVGNTGNLGLPVCLLAFGDEGLAYGITFFAVQCFLLFSVGEVIISGAFRLRSLLRSPILHAVWLGVFARITGADVPEFLMNTLQLAGQIVIPIMLITLGVSLAGMRATQLPSTLAWSLSRTVVALFIGVLVAQFFAFEGAARGVLIIQTIAPVAVFNYLLAIRHGKDSSEVSGLILVTHIMAVFYLPLVLAFVL